MRQLFKSMEKNVGAKGIGTSAVPKENHTPPTLAELGVDKKTSMVAQQHALYRHRVNDCPCKCCVVQRVPSL